MINKYGFDENNLGYFEMVVENFAYGLFSADPTDEARERMNHYDAFIALESAASELPLSPVFNMGTVEESQEVERQYKNWLVYLSSEAGKDEADVYWNDLIEGYGEMGLRLSRDQIFNFDAQQDLARNLLQKIADYMQERFPADQMETIFSDEVLLASYGDNHQLLSTEDLSEWRKDLIQQADDLRIVQSPNRQTRQIQNQGTLDI